VLEVVERHTRISDTELRRRVAEAEELLASGKADDAQKLASQLETAYPERADLAILTGRALIAQNRMRAATESFARAVGLDPQSAEAHHLLGFAAVRTGELDRAQRAWETYLKLVPQGHRRQHVAQALAALRALTQIVQVASPQ
jgi:Flp pilus assembly protein TadD